jgi:hypothetical protein
MQKSPDPKIPFIEFKNLLGTLASGRSDAEIEQMREIEYRLANIIFDSWLRNRKRPPELAEISDK